MADASFDTLTVQALNVRAAPRCAQDPRVLITLPNGATVGDMLLAIQELQAFALNNGDAKPPASSPPPVPVLTNFLLADGTPFLLADGTPFLLIAG